MNAVTELDRKDSKDRVASDLLAASWRYPMVDAVGEGQAMWKHLGLRVQHGVLRAVLIGAGLTGGFYAVLGISAAHCATMSGFSPLWSAGTAAVFPAIGLGLGALIGAIVGRDEVEKETRLVVKPSGSDVSPSGSIAA